MSIKVAMISLGCPKNQVEAEHMLALLADAGCELVGDASEAQVAVVNTCGFIDSAKQEAIDSILEMAALKQQGLCGIVVTGCLAERYRQQIRQQMPEVDVVLGGGSVGDIVEAVQQAAQGKSFERYADIEKAPLGGDRLLTTPFYTAYLKLGDGCDNFCTYCAIPLIRGRLRSRPLEELVQEAQAEKDRMLSNAKAEAAQEIQRLESEKQAAQQKLAMAQEKLAEFIRRSDELCQAQSAFLQTLPELELVPAAAETAEKPDAVVGAIEQDILTQYDAAPDEKAEEMKPAVTDEPTIQFPPVNDNAVPTDFKLSLDELKFGRNYNGGK